MDDRYPTRLTLLCVTVFLSAAAAAVALAVSGDRPEWGPLVVFAVLGTFADNLDVKQPSGVNAGAGFMMQIAAIVVFRSQDSVLGPLIVGMVCGLFYVSHLRTREWRKVVFNMGNFGLDALAAAGLFALLPASWLENTPQLLVGALLAAAVYFFVNNSLLALVISIANDRPVVDVARDFKVNELAAIPFAVFGVFVGRLYLDFGSVVVPLLIVPILVARQTFASYLALKQSHEDTIRILIGALEAKDRYTAGHAERVAKFAQYIGSELALSPRRLERLRLAALMHDVGKLVVPNHLLNKPGKLTAEEFARVRQHERVSVEILTRIDFLAPVAPSAMSEFTHFQPVADETGRPIEPHIVAVADAFDAMTSTRSYRKALSQTTAFMELREKAGVQFHPHCVDALIVAIERRGEVYGAGHEDDAHEFDVEPPAAGTGSAGLGDLLRDESSTSRQAATS